MPNCSQRLPRLLPVFLLLAASLTHADWLPLTRDGDPAADRYRTYIDPTSIVRKGDQVMLRVLMNYRERSEEGIASAVAVNEFDCVNDRVRSRSVVAHAEPDGKGRVIREFKGLGAWSAIPPGTINEVLLESACDFYPQWWSE
jgi:hypothetical protein